MQLNENRIQNIRNDFPILKETVYGKPLVYFDNAATTHKPLTVLHKIEFAYNHLNA
ncbi:MAG: cysteine desulfurase CsdA, partial [Bacteroidales bacterium]|nr:cysteine desulfurase CsdA [Bacteroidales bacterium]